jgi:hypothetical protein
MSSSDQRSSIKRFDSPGERISTSQLAGLCSITSLIPSGVGVIVISPRVTRTGHPRSASVPDRGCDELVLLANEVIVGSTSAAANGPSDLGPPVPARRLARLSGAIKLLS